MAVVPLHHLAIDADPVPDLHDHFDDLDAGRFQQRLSAHWRRSGRPHSRAGDARHPLSAARCRGSVDGGHRLRAAAGASAGVFYDEAAVEMKLSLRGVATEAKLLLIGIPLLLWTMLPIYHLFLFAISPKDSAFAGNLWPDHPTLHNFAVVFGEQHYYLSHFWRQLFNSLVIALAVGAITLLLAWNEYLYAFLLLSKDTDVTLAVGLGNFLAADDSPWELLMATGLIYALPPAAIYYAFRRYMVAGLTAGAVKG